MIQAVSDLKASFLWSSFHGSKKYDATSQGREAIKLSYLVATPVNKSDDEHCEIQRGNKGHSPVSGNQQFSNGT